LERASSKRKLKRLPGSSTRAKTVQRAR
jgi:hypothetical protein